ncbi:DUF2334 domain-containing protein, partial [Bacillus velezensis]|uniref:DUF2334 domain-containing protein n=1 Tax=Bacillus velezensis TaxID=492670 RepID=UPI0011A809F1
LYFPLQDISPISHQTFLYRPAPYLHKTHIPFILPLIPVYLNPKDPEKLYCAHKPKILTRLKKLHQIPATIIIHP